MERPVRTQPTPGEVIIVLAAAAMLLFSFIAFADGVSSWGSGVFPLATLLPLYGILMAGALVAEFAGANLPRTVVGFSWPQLQLAFGLMAGVLAIGFALANIREKQAGLWLEVLGGLALAVGAVMLQRERRGETLH